MGSRVSGQGIPVLDLRRKNRTANALRVDL